MEREESDRTLTLPSRTVNCIGCEEKDCSHCQGSQEASDGFIPAVLKDDSKE
jgi:hypothetical protein